MRITQQMMVNRVTRNLSANISRIMELQGQLSSARQINKPSDDPIGVTRDLSFRSQISDIEQYQRNISWATSSLGMVEQSLGSIADFVNAAREIAVALANDTYDENARSAAAREVESIFERMLSTSNTKIEDRYIFSGYKTRTAAFSASSTGVVYQGDEGRINIEIAAGSLLEANQIGSEVMMEPLTVLGDDFDLNPGITRDVLLAILNDGAGVDLGAPANGRVQVKDNNTGTTVVVDLSAETTVGDVIDKINADLAAAGITDLTAEVSPIGNALRLTPTANPTITDQTPLANLNNGIGIETVPGTFRVTDGGAIDVTIDISGATTVGDVRTAFNSQLAAAGVVGVQMTINAGNTGLTITDATPLGLTISDFDAQSTAHDLGLTGSVGSQLNGEDLLPKPDYTVTEVAGGSVAADLGIAGSFHTTFDGADVNPTLTLTTPVTELFNTLGADLGRIRVAQGTNVRTIDLSSAVTIGDVLNLLNNSGLSITAGLNAQATGIQVEPTLNNQTLMITSDDDLNTAKKLGIYGSPDIFGSLMLLAEALDNNDQASIGGMIDALESAANRLLEQRASVGAKIVRLETTSTRLTELNLSLTSLLSEVEDADILKVTTDLASQENVYQAALNATARIIAPSLIDFMS